MYKLVIFDLDGTLADTLGDLAYSGNAALAQFGFEPHDTDRYRYFVGDGIPMLIRRILPEKERNDERILQVKSAFDEIYSKHFDVYTKPYKGMPELLETLSERGIMTAVASNKADEFTQAVVDKLFSHKFSCVCGKKDGFDKKPSPMIADYIINTLAANKEQTLFIGDSGVDMQTAHNAGIKSVGCLWGFRTKEELTENNADYLVEKPSEIERIIFE